MRVTTSSHFSISWFSIFFSDLLHARRSQFSRMRPSMSSPRGMYSKQVVVYNLQPIRTAHNYWKLTIFPQTIIKNHKIQSKFLPKSSLLQCESSKLFIIFSRKLIFRSYMSIFGQERMLNYSNKSRPILDGFSKATPIKQNTPELKRLAFRPLNLDISKKMLTSSTYEPVLTPKTARTTYHQNTVLTESTYSKSPRVMINQHASRRDGSFIKGQTHVQGYPSGYPSESTQGTVMEGSKRGEFRQIDNLRLSRPSRTAMFKQAPEKGECDLSRLRKTVNNATSWLTRNNMPTKPDKSHVDFDGLGTESGKSERAMRKKIESEYLPSTKIEGKDQQQNDIPVSMPITAVSTALTSSKYVPRAHNRTKTTLDDPCPSPSITSKQQKSQNTTPRISQQKLTKSFNLKLDKMNRTDPSCFSNSLSSTTQRQLIKERSFSLQDFQMGPCKGEGRFGKVFPARHKKTGFLCAVKQVKKQGVRLMLQQFIQQVKISLFLSHPNVVKFYGCFQDALHFYILMEYMEDGSLYRLIKGGKKMTQEEAVPKLAEVCHAVGYLHSLDILHRDIKPQNIVISNGVCKLCDFGWAAYSKERRTTYCGTLDYVCPQIIEGESYDNQVDIWAIGVLAFEMLVGRAPFYHISRQQTMKSIVKCEFGFPEEMSHSARTFIARSLQQDKWKRVTIEDMLRDRFLEEGLRGFQ